VERQEPIRRVTAKSHNEAGRVAAVWRGDGVLPGGRPPGLRHHYERDRDRCLSAPGRHPARSAVCPVEESALFPRLARGKSGVVRRGCSDSV